MDGERDELKERRLKAMISRLRDHGDHYEYCLMEDYEDLFVKFACEAIEMANIFVNLVITRKKTFLSSLFFWKEDFTIDEIAKWLDTYGVSYNLRDDHGFYVERANGIDEITLYKGNPVVLYKKGKFKMYYEIDDLLEVTEIYQHHHLIGNTDDAEPVTFDQHLKEINLDPVHDFTFWVEKMYEMVTPVNLDEPYYRPVIFNGDIENINIFLVGMNPATPIYPKDVELHDYIRLLFYRNEFLEYYSDLRLSENKPALSRTRIGISGFTDVLQTHTFASIAETNVIPYPTHSLEELFQQPEEVIERGKNIFYELLTIAQPNLLIFHSKEALKMAVEIMIRKGMLLESPIDFKQPLKSIESQVPLFEFQYEKGNKGYVLACRHLMYYGEKGHSFQPFVQKVIDLMNNGYKKPSI